MSISLAHKFFKTSVLVLEKTLKFISDDLYFKVIVGLLDEINPVYSVSTKNGNINFRCVSETVRIRAREMLLREPETLEWIDSFGSDEIFWDVGSNIGVFSLYAAVTRGVRVVALDPLPQNYHSLIENAALSNVSELIEIYCVAASDETIVAPLYISSEANTAGGANCPFGENTSNYGKPVTPARRISALGFSIDDFLKTFEVPFPNHLKVDIDGVQEKVIVGAHDTLRDPRLLSVMFELQPGNIKANKKANTFIEAELKKSGFSLRKTVAATPNMTNDPEISVTNNFFHRA